MSRLGRMGLRRRNNKEKGLRIHFQIDQKLYVALTWHALWLNEMAMKLPIAIIHSASYPCLLKLVSFYCCAK